MAQKFLTSLEITDTHIKIVQAKDGRGPSSAVTCDVRRIEPSSEEGCFKLLSAMAAEHRLRQQPVVLIIPRRLVLLRHLDLPSQDHQEIKKMVSLQVMDKVPYSREDVVYDHAVIEKQANGYSKVLVVLVHRDVVHRYLKMASAAGISPVRVTVSSSGLAAWWANRHKEQRFASSVSMIINIDEIDAEICFCRGGNFLFSRHVQLGARDLNTEHMDQFLQQVDLTLKTYAKDKMGPAPEHFALVSTMPQAEELRTKIQAEHKRDVELFSPLDELPDNIKRSEKMTVWERSGYSAAVGLGTVLGDKERSFNLLPSEIKDSKAVTADRQKWVRLAALSITVIALIAGAAGIDIYRQQNNIDQLRAKAKGLEPEVAKAQELIRLVDFADAHIRQQVMMTDILAELYRLTPGEISFRSLSVNASGSITLQGYAQTRTSVNSFQSQLVNSGVFKNVTLQYASRSRVVGKELTDFKMTLEMPRGQGGDK